MPIFKYAYIFPLLAGEALFLFLGLPYSQQRYQNYEHISSLNDAVFFSSSIIEISLWISDAFSVRNPSAF